MEELCPRHSRAGSFRNASAVNIKAPSPKQTNLSRLRLRFPPALKPTGAALSGAAWHMVSPVLTSVTNQDHLLAAGQVASSPQQSPHNTLATSMQRLSNTLAVTQNTIAPPEQPPEACSGFAGAGSASSGKALRFVLSCWYLRRSVGVMWRMGASSYHDPSLNPALQSSADLSHLVRYEDGSYPVIYSLRETFRLFTLHPERASDSPLSSADGDVLIYKHSVFGLVWTRADLLPEDSTSPRTDSACSSDGAFPELPLL